MFGYGWSFSYIWGQLAQVWRSAFAFVQVETSWTQMFFDREMGNLNHGLSFSFMCWCWIMEFSSAKINGTSTADLWVTELFNEWKWTHVRSPVKLVSFRWLLKLLNRNMPLHCIIAEQFTKAYFKKQLRQERSSSIAEPLVLFDH